DAQPSDANAIGAVASLLESGGYPQLAFFRANDAVAAYFQADPTPVEAPYNLLTMYQRLFSLMLSDGLGPAPTSVAGSSETVTFSLAAQTVTLSAMVSGASGQVDGGTVTFIVTGVGNPVTSQPVVNGAVSAALTIPGGTAAGSYSIQAVYTGTAAFSPSADATQSLTISRATPTITWNTPTSIPAGTALGPSQLNATTSVPGTFVYNPPAGTVPPSGTTQTLNVTFTPTDSTDYNSTTSSVSLTVQAGTFSGSASPTSATIKVGHSQTFVITINSGTLQGAVSFSCANPPTGISCKFSPGQANLAPNASATTQLTVTVSAKPTSRAGLLSVWPPADEHSHPRIAPQFAMSLLVLATLMAVIGVRRTASFGASAAKSYLTLALLLLLVVSLNSCTSATFLGNGTSSTGSGGNGSPASVSLVVQGTSGGTVTTITTISITVP
ncbi:MAG TPA: Ig-like domain-containing protein, partial [Terriglobales bacterium]